MHKLYDQYFVHHFYTNKLEFSAYGNILEWVEMLSVAVNFFRLFYAFDKTCLVTIPLAI